MEVDSEEDKRLKAILLRIRYIMRCRSRCDWVFRDANHQLPQPRARRIPLYMMGKVYLGELQWKEDRNDRYVAALRGETFTRNPYARIQSIPKRNNTEADKEQKLDNDQRKQIS
ncbi:hypothetical protein NC651_025089 [Populus alba x Populus x berolinensis]|nr:hypothetical protein NC651_025089 [Populus alba x Populus x berolinensis]